MDSQIKSNFNNKNFASLEYLSNKELWSEDNNNLGLYYFLLELQGKDTSEVLSNILHIKKTDAASYRYLGDVAFELYSSRDKYEIPIYYYKEALKYDGRNSHVLWNLYTLTKRASYFLTAIKINYETKKLDLVSKILLNTHASNLIQAEFVKKDWLDLKKICLDKNVSHDQGVLLISLFYLKEFDHGVSIINKEEWVSKRILDLYLDEMKIDFNFAIEKAYYNDRIKYLKGDSKSIYEVVKKEAKKGNKNPTKEVIIKYAFEAEDYSAVISLVDELINNNKNTDNQQRLYHIFSSLYLNINVNKEFEEAVNKQNYFRGADCNPLYLAYLILRNIKELELYLDNKEDFIPIEQMSLYQEAEEYLSHDSLLDNYMHESLVEMLNSLKNKCEKQLVNFEIEKLKNFNEPLMDSDKTQLASYLLKANRTDEAMLLLAELGASMTVNNLRGVSYEKQGKLDTALKHYKLAIDLMESSAEMNDIIISNYLSCLNRSKHSISQPLYNGYIDKFNESIAGQFKYRLFRAQNGNSLFKYYPFNQFTLDALVNGYFYLASSEELNDPIELPYDSLIADIKDDLFLRSDFRLASFSHNENSMLMWSHYAANHTGLMVEYAFEGDLPKGVGIDEVSYSHTIKRYKEKERYLFNQYMLTKNKDWSYEKEVRLFAYKTNKLHNKKYRYPAKENNMANAYIKSITVGYKFPESTIKLIHDIISSLNERNDKHLPKIKLRKAKLSESNFFELKYEVIN
jgi:hypothetical protein